MSRILIRLKILHKFNRGILYHGYCQKMITMKIDEDAMKKMNVPGLQELRCAFEKYGHELRIAGGPVRDILIGLTPHDFDLATTARPDQMKVMFDKENIRIISTKGEEHGTITARLADCNYDCTTLRLDRFTDGRHAEVEFITDWELDSKRRDLTINAMYLGFDGTVYDYNNGIAHLKKRHVTFVGNASGRIQEDYLRILRYFRFFGRVSESELHDESTIESIKENASGLAIISGQRLFIELKKIVSGRMGDHMMAKMKECGIFPLIGLNETFDLDNFRKVYNRCNIKNMKEVSILTAGFLSLPDALAFISRVHCSNQEKRAINFILKFRDKKLGKDEIESLLIDLYYLERVQKSKIIEMLGELWSYNGLQTEEVTKLQLPSFPLHENDLPNMRKVEQRKIISALVNIWKSSNYNMTKEELLKYVQRHLRA